MTKHSIRLWELIQEKYPELAEQGKKEAREIIEYEKKYEKFKEIS